MKLPKNNPHTARYHMQILRAHSKGVAALRKLGIPSLKVADQMTSAMSAGATKADVEYTYLKKYRPVYRKGKNPSNLRVPGPSASWKGHWVKLAEMVGKAWQQFLKSQESMLYLFYRPSTAKDYGALAVAADAPRGFQLARNERIGLGWTEGRFRREVLNIAAALPLLPYGKNPANPRNLLAGIYSKPHARLKLIREYVGGPVWPWRLLRLSDISLYKRFKSSKDAEGWLKRNGFVGDAATVPTANPGISEALLTGMAAAVGGTVGAVAGDKILQQTKSVTDDLKDVTRKLGKVVSGKNPESPTTRYKMPQYGTLGRYYVAMYSYDHVPTGKRILEEFSTTKANAAKIFRRLGVVAENGENRTLTELCSSWSSSGPRQQVQ